MDRLMVLGDSLYLRTTGDDVGATLWRVQGSSAEAIALPDWRTDPRWSYFSYAVPLGVVGGQLILETNRFPYQWWTYDGQVWQPLAQVDGGTSVNDADELVEFRGRAYFTEQYSGNRLIEQTGSEFRVVSEPGPNGYARLHSLRALEDSLYWIADRIYDSDRATELWSYDGTSSRFVLDLRDAYANMPLESTQLTIVGESLFVMGQPQLNKLVNLNPNDRIPRMWRVEEDDIVEVPGSLGVSHVESLHSDHLVTFHGRLTGCCKPSASNLMTARVFDGNTFTDAAIPDQSPVYPLTSFANFGSVTWLGRGGGPLVGAIDGQLVLPGYSADGYELWTIDAGMYRQLADLNREPLPAGVIMPVGFAPPPVTQSSSPQSFTRVGESLYFVANDGVHGPSLWRLTSQPVPEPSSAAIALFALVLARQFGRACTRRFVRSIG